jgi:hypothetical protein
MRNDPIQLFEMTPFGAEKSATRSVQLAAIPVV